MKREQDEGKRRRHHQLDVGRPREQKRAEGEEDRGDEGGREIPRQPASQQVHPDHRERQTDQDGRVVRGVGAVGQQVSRDAEDAGAKVGFRVRECGLVGMKDVRVKDVLTGRNGVTHPGHVPDTELTVAQCEASEPGRPQRQRPGEIDRQRQRDEGDALRLRAT